MTAKHSVTIDRLDEAELGALAAHLAPLLRSGDVVLLDGPLGAGKTSLARAVIRAACAEPELEVPSPTFTLVQLYDAQALTLWHFDLYRLSEAAEVIELGWEDALADGIALVEWPDRLGRLTPPDAWRVTLTPQENDRRQVTITGPRPLCRFGLM